METLKWLEIGDHCPWCSTYDNTNCVGTKVYHTDSPCPFVKRLAFYKDGTLKSVTFKGKDDVAIDYELPEEEED